MILKSPAPSWGRFCTASRTSQSKIGRFAILDPVQNHGRGGVFGGIAGAAGYFHADGHDHCAGHHHHAADGLDHLSGDARAMGGTSWRRIILGRRAGWQGMWCLCRKAACMSRRTRRRFLVGLRRLWMRWAGLRRRRSGIQLGCSVSVWVAATRIAEARRVMIWRRTKARMNIAVRIRMMVGAGALSRKKLV